MRSRTKPKTPVSRYAAIALLVAMAAWMVSGQAIRRSAETRLEQPPARDHYVGDAACRSCHQKEFDSYQATAHHLTSRTADAHSIIGKFDAGENIFRTANPALYFKMTSDADGFHQTAVDEVAPGKNIELSQRFDIVVGSGRKAQTYLYWKGDLLYELPVSWWVQSGQWINSPGYEDGNIRFDRPIYPRCLECHGSYFESEAPPPNRFDRSSIVTGVECEKCHGPGREHVALYGGANPPRAGANKAIVNPASLPRNRNIDTCALCHSGLGNPLAPALSYAPGAALEKYLQFPVMDPDLAVDVHGNQVQLLKASRCFRSSQMTCTTCHNVHTPQREAAAFSHYCLDCHKAQQCGQFATMGEKITRDCVDCHMPLKKSQALFSNSNQQTLQLPVRTHRIAIYADATMP
jgi:hypothetical protein